MSMFQAFLVLCLSGYSVYCQVPELGECPDVKLMQDFDIEKFLGVWYTTERYCEACVAIFKCVSMNITRDDHGIVHVVKDAIDRMTGNRIIAPHTLEQSDSTDLAKLAIWNPMIPHQPNYIPDFWILDTNYESYCIVYYCAKGKSLNHYKNVIIYTRDPQPSEDVVAKYVEVTERHNFKRINFKSVKQDDCTLTASK